MSEKRTYGDLDEGQLADLVYDLGNKGFGLTAGRSVDGRFTLTASRKSTTPRAARIPTDTGAALAQMGPRPSRPIPNFVGSGAGIGEDDFQRAADALECDVAAVKAVSDVESAGSGRLPDNRPKILFEAHHFSRRTGRVFDGSHPDISAPRWDRSLSNGGAAEYDRLDQALRLNRNAALAAASWGRFQIMGFNYEICGYRSITAFVGDMVESEGGQLNAFVGFIKGRRLDDDLRSHDWAAFAHGYNGAAYKENAYDQKMANAWARHANGDWLSDREVQAALNRAGADPALVTDGAIGAKTRKAIRVFQKTNGLAVDGRITPKLIQALLRV